MKKRTALLIAIITAFTAMPASPVYADTAIPEEGVLFEGAEAELSNGVAVMAESTEPDGESVALDDGALYATVDAGKQDALRL